MPKVATQIEVAAKKKELELPPWVDREKGVEVKYMPDPMTGKDELVAMITQQLPSVMRGRNVRAIRMGTQLEYRIKHVDVLDENGNQNVIEIDGGRTKSGKKETIYARVVSPGSIIVRRGKQPVPADDKLHEGLREVDVLLLDGTARLELDRDLYLGFHPDLMRKG